MAKTFNLNSLAFTAGFKTEQYTAQLGDMGFLQLSKAAMTLGRWYVTLKCGSISMQFTVDAAHSNPEQAARLAYDAIRDHAESLAKGFAVPTTEAE